MEGKRPRGGAAGGWADAIGWLGKEGQVTGKRGEEMVFHGAGSSVVLYVRWMVARCGDIPRWLSNSDDGEEECTYWFASGGWGILLYDHLPVDTWWPADIPESTSSAQQDHYTTKPPCPAAEGVWVHQHIYVAYAGELVLEHYEGKHCSSWAPDGSWQWVTIQCKRLHGRCSHTYIPICKALRFASVICNSYRPAPWSCSPSILLLVAA